MAQATKLHSPVDVEKRKNLNVRSGDSVRVSIRIEEKGKTRLQEFEGLVLACKHGTEPGATITVRRTTGGVGVEKIFPLFSPVIEKIEVVRRARVRQANLYHVRRKAAKEVRRHIKNVRVVSETDMEQEGDTGTESGEETGVEEGSRDDVSSQDLAEEQTVNHDEVTDSPGTEEDKEESEKKEASA